jgi:[acyl-carrier-protein] S-malonyltransferase
MSQHCFQTAQKPKTSQPTNRRNNHQSLMEPARTSLEAALSSVPVAAPRLPVISNVTARPFPSDPDAIRKLLGRQLVEPVQWEATLEALVVMSNGGGGGGSSGGGGGASGNGVFYELGPGAQIKSMVRRVDGGVWKGMVNVSAA